MVTNKSKSLSILPVSVIFQSGSKKEQIFLVVYSSVSATAYMPYKHNSQSRGYREVASTADHHQLLCLAQGQTQLLPS
jgi:hypothetical protein